MLVYKSIQHSKQYYTGLKYVIYLEMTD